MWDNRGEYLIKNYSGFNKAELLSALKREVDPECRELLAGNSGELVISVFNRNTLLRMLEMDISADDDMINADDVRSLVRELQDFLDAHMKERPEGHIWIILSCVFLCFIVKEPMHPQSIVHWTMEQDGNYHCPARTTEEGSICRWCAASLPEKTESVRQDMFSVSDEDK